MKHMLVSVLHLALTGLFIVPALAQKPEWQGHIGWCIGNHTSDPGETNCVDQYVATEAKCAAPGVEGAPASWSALSIPQSITTVRMPFALRRSASATIAMPRQRLAQQEKLLCATI